MKIVNIVVKWFGFKIQKIKCIDKSEMTNTTVDRYGIHIAYYPEKFHYEYKLEKINV